MVRTRLAIWLGAWAWALTACFGNSSSPSRDGGSLADASAGLDAGADGGSLADASAGLDAGADGDATSSGAVDADTGPDQLAQDAAGDSEGGTPLKFKAVTVSNTGSCALTVDGVAYCWGASGALGSSTVVSSNVPIPVETSERFDSVGLGDGVACGLTSTGNAFCWGNNPSGSVGDGTMAQRKTPVAVSGGLVFTSISVGAYTVCATTSQGEVYCWGSNSLGVLGDGTTTDRSVPTKVASTLAFAQVSTGGFHTCAITTTGTAWCWGSNSSGALGDGTKNDALAPTAVVGGLSFGFIVAAEDSKTCALTLDGSAYCWGSQAYGALGNGVDDRVLADAISTPVAVSGGGHYTALAGDVYSSCAVTSAGSGECWGFDGDGNLGDGSTTNRPVPGPISTTLTLSSIAMSHYTNSHACALTTAGDIVCWGTGGGGELGDGTSTSTTTPVPILAPRR
jgi:alpha-tubulin suppressor-like RCC1 family protein